MDDNNLNILYHFRVRGLGAEGVHIAGIVNGFRALGHSVRFVSPTNIDPTLPPTVGPHVSTLLPQTALLHKLADLAPQPFFEFMELCYNFLAIFRLWRSVHVRRPDFIYERYAFFNFSGALIAKKKNVPFVVEVNELSGHKRVRGQFFIRLCSAIEKRILRQADLIVTVSEFLNREVSAQVDKNKTIVLTIPNGVPATWLERHVAMTQVTNLRERLNLRGKKVICFVGGLVHWHNFDLLLLALRDLRAIEKDVVVLMVGDGPMRQYILDKSNELEIPASAVIMTGTVAHAHIPLYLNASDVAIIPETNEFRSPIKMFEYMAMALPVIAPKKPTIEAVITNGIEGVLFEPGNSTSLTQALLKCISDSELSKKIGMNGQQKVRENFTWEKHAELIARMAILPWSRKMDLNP